MEQGSIPRSDETPTSGRPRGLSKPSKPRARIAAFLTVTVALGVVATLIAVWLTASQNSDRLTQELELRLRSETAVVVDRMQNVEKGIRGTRGAVLVGGQEHMSASTYRIFAQARDESGEFPAAREFGFIRREAGRAIVQFSSPSEDQSRLIGMDISALPALAAAADNAMNSGLATMTPPLSMPFVDSAGGPSCMVLLPIYRPGLPRSARAERRAATLGWAFALIDLSAVVRGLPVDDDVELEIEDVSGAGSATPLVSWGRGARTSATNVTPPLVTPPLVTPPLVTPPLVTPLFGRLWSFTAHAGPRFAAGLHRTAPETVAFLGGLLSLLAAALAATLASYLQRSAEVHAQRALLASVAANASDAMIMESTDGTVLSWNAAASTLFGYSAEEATSTRLADLILPRDRAAEDAFLLAQCANGCPVAPFDAVRWRRDGSPVDVSITVAPVFGFRGQVVAVAKTIRDITARKALDRELRSGMEQLEQEVVRRTEALAEVERNLRAVTDAMPSMIAYWDKDGVNRFANKAHEKWYGLVSRSMAGRRLEECFEESVVARIRPHFEAALRGESVIYEMEIPARGSDAASTLQVHNIPDTVKGETRGIYVLVHDISALKRSQTELAESRAFLEQAGAISGVGGFRIDLLSGNQVWTRQTFAIYEIDGEIAPSAEDLDKLMEPAVASRLWQAIRAASDRGEGYDLEMPVRTARGRPIWVRTIGVVELERGRPARVVGAIQDITDRKNVEEQLRMTSERFVLAADAAGIGVWEWNPLTDSLTWDALMFQIYGMDMSSGPVAWQAWSDRVHVDDRQRAVEEMRTALASDAVMASEFRITLPSGEVRHLQTAAKVQRDAEGRPLRLVGIDVDVTGRKTMESALADAAQRDKLTGLMNRAVFMQRLEAAILRLGARTQAYFAVLFLDFDRFKLINDTLGHEAGDELLRQIAGRLRRALRAADTLNAEDTGNVVSRFGGDEFLLLINDLKEPGHALRIAERLLDALAPPYHIQGSEVHSSASVGIVTSDQCESSAEEVVRNADVAMYEAKRAGRACSVVFNEAMHARLTRHVSIENNLRRAIGTAELHIVYQPIVDLNTNRMVSAEALVRWHSPVLGEIAPAEFIPIAEETGLIVTLGEWVQDTACEAMAHWRATDPARAPATISVNLSRAELALGQRLMAQVKATLRRHELPASCLQLEITEREIMRHPEESRALMVELRQFGIKLAMDDFGTGTSSLAFLRNYPFDTIKIDRSFLQDLTSVSDVLAVIHATINLVENLGMASLAEGVEDAGQLAILQSLGCRYAQGFLFSRPVAADRLLSTMQAALPALADVG